MYNLHIEHPVPDYQRWKQAFDSDPVDRKKMGVRGYQVSRDAGDPNYVTIDLQFDTQPEAEALLAAMQVVWGRVQGSVMNDPKTRISEIMESR
jgi:hypothetical protein